MNKRESNKRLLEIDSEIKNLHSERSSIVGQLRRRCKHNKISGRIIYNTDEFGRFDPYYNDYEYLCSECGIKILSEETLSDDEIKGRFKNLLHIKKS